MPMSLLGLGGGMIVNGLMNALVSSINSRKTLAANAEQQQKNFEFQEAIQQKQWKHAEMLQREMREMTRRNFLDQIKHQQQTEDLRDLSQRWPLPAISPRHIINEFNAYLDAGEFIPLQLIIVENGDQSKGPLAIRQQVRKSINELNKFMSQHYGQNTTHAVKIHDTFKSGANFGASEVDTVFQVFKVAPTMILTVRVDGSKYILECWHWGYGAVIKPALVEVFRCDVEELQFSILKQIATEWVSDKTKYQIADLDKDALVDLIERIEAERKRLIQKGATDEILQEYGYKPFVEELSQYTTLNASSINKLGRVNAAPFVKKINAGIEQSLLSSLKICSSLLSDAHFLLEYKEPPKFMQICSDELHAVPKLMNQVDMLFSAAIQALPDYKKVDKALMHTRLAMAYQDAHYPEKALECSYNCSHLLEEMVEPRDFALTASKDMQKCVDELKRIKGVAELIPWIAEQTTVTFTPDELNQRAASLYQSGKIKEALSIWGKAVEQGHKKSMRNLAAVLESISRKDEAFRIYALAIKHGVEEVFHKGHDLALWYCNKGDWVEAFDMWCYYLSSGDKKYYNEAGAYSAFLLFTTAITEILETDINRWGSMLHLYQTNSTPQSIAENFLLSKVSSNSLFDKQLLPFYDVLSTWYMKSKGHNIPLIYGINTDIELQYVLPNKLPHEYEMLFKLCISKTGRPDINNK